MAKKKKGLKIYGGMVGIAKSGFGMGKKGRKKKKG
jgi:hypothetical protein